MIPNSILISLSVVLVLTSLNTHLAFASNQEEDEDGQDNSDSQNETTQQSKVTWKTYSDGKGLTTVKYPSNWVPTNVLESLLGPVDLRFSYPDDNTSKAEVDVVQYAEPSVFKPTDEHIYTLNEPLYWEISGNANLSTVTKFEIEQPIECQKFTLNGLPACSVIYEIHDLATSPKELVVLAVSAVDPDGTEFRAHYTASFDLFKHFLPTAEYMIKSFQTTEPHPKPKDFSLSSSNGSSNIPGQATNSSSSSDFTLS